MRSTRLVTAFAILFTTAAFASGQTVTNLWNFQTTFGINPFGPLTQGQDGNLYGTTINGGTNGLGLDFEISPEATFNWLQAFDGTRGAQPLAGMTLGTNGRFYGTASRGGAFADGTLFAATAASNATLRSIHDFHGSDGRVPTSSLLLAGPGRFLGTTQNGGANDMGTVFQIDGSGILTTLHSFSGLDGANPANNGLVQGIDGAFYGETYLGGAHGIGTVYRITSSSFRTLFSFVGTPFGAIPLGTLIQATDGNFYGTTNQNVFRITPNGTFSVVYKFGSSSELPNAGLVQATDGKLYGTTVTGGAHNYGTLFSVTTDGVYTRLFDFDWTLYGASPSGPLVQHTNGELYGLAEDGGSLGLGTIFSLDMGLAPFVETVLNRGAVGSQIEILGNNLMGTTAVAFGSLPAAFTVVSDTYITAIVPAGATSGPIHVTTPDGPLTSNVNFNVH